VLGQFKELVELIDEPIAAIDSQVKVIESALSVEEEKKKADKLEVIKAIWKSLGVEWLTFEEVVDEMILNAKLEDVKELIEMKVNACKGIIETLDEDLAVAYIQGGYDINKAYEIERARNKAIEKYNTLKMPF
jgi:hypothetical protein